MEKVDTRRLKAEVQEQIRFQAIRLRKAGRKYKEIEEILGVCHTTICAWYKKYEREGKKGIRAQKRGRKVGSCRTLNVEQEKRIQKLIQDKCPDQLKLPFALWTGIAVQQLIRRVWSIGHADQDRRGVPETMGIYSSKALAKSL